MMEDGNAATLCCPLCQFFRDHVDAGLVRNLIIDRQKRHWAENARSFWQIQFGCMRGREASAPNLPTENAQVQVGREGVRCIVISEKVFVPRIGAAQYP